MDGLMERPTDASKNWRALCSIADYNVDHTVVIWSSVDNRIVDLGICVTQGKVPGAPFQVNFVVVVVVAPIPFSTRSKPETWVSLLHIESVEKLPLTTQGCPLSIKCKNFLSLSFIIPKGWFVWFFFDFFCGILRKTPCMLEIQLPRSF